MLTESRKRSRTSAVTVAWLGAISEVPTPRRCASLETHCPREVASIAARDRNGAMFTPLEAMRDPTVARTRRTDETGRGVTRCKSALEGSVLTWATDGEF